MTAFQQAGLSITASAPLATGGPLVDTYVDRVTQYSHTINAWGGFMYASVTLGLDLSAIDEWYANGLGRHIVVYDEAQQVIWEGFVNAIMVRVGGLKAERGPLLGIANRAKMIYSTVDTSTTPPTVGQRAATAFASNAPSQLKYGIVEKILSTGGASAADALQIATTYVAEHCEPETNEVLNVGGMQDSPTIELKLVGYIHWLGAYVYTNTGGGVQTLDAKIKNVLIASPNIFPFSADQSNIVANALTVPTYDNDYREAWGVVKSLVARGDTANGRWLYQMYADRKMHYYAAPTTFEYRHVLSEGRPHVERYNDDSRVLPWAIKPGKWIVLPDFVVGTQATAISTDPRAMFIESVNYGVPYNVTLDGGSISTLPQKLAAMGLSGIGA